LGISDVSVSESHPLWQVTFGIGRKRELEAAKQRKAEEEDKRRRLEEVERELAKKMQAKIEKERELAKMVCCMWFCIYTWLRAPS
jgi:hypothetical protein